MIELWFYSMVYTLTQVTIHGHKPLVFIIFFLFCRDYLTRLKRKMKRWKKKWLVNKQLKMWMDIILNIVIVCVNMLMWLSLNLVSQPEPIPSLSLPLTPTKTPTDVLLNASYFLSIEVNIRKQCSFVSILTKVILL